MVWQLVMLVVVGVVWVVVVVVVSNIGTRVDRG